MDDQSGHDLAGFAVGVAEKSQIIDGSKVSDPSIQYMAPFIPYDKKNELKRRLYELISEQREKDAQAGKGRFRGEQSPRQ